MEHEHGLAAFHRGFEHFLRVGELLLRAKDVAGHGKWTDWLLSNTAISETAARGYMRMAEEYPNLDAEKRQRVADLPWREALKAIAKPREADPAAITSPSASASSESDKRVKTLVTALAQCRTCRACKGPGRFRPRISSGCEGCRRS